MKKVIVTIALLAMVAVDVFAKGQQGSGAAPAEKVSVLVYITGQMAGSPPYQMLADGATKFAASNPNVTVKVYEAGFNQAEWESQLEEQVASGEYNLVLGSNPSLPEICANVGKKFPDIKFIITDAELKGNPQIATYLYNQYEQALYLGYLAGLITTSDMPHANADKKLGFIAAQEYPLLSKHIVPGFTAGAQMVDPAITVDFRVIGNWYDANKAAELAGSAMDTGVDCFSSIAGGTAAGMNKTLQDRGGYAVAFNTNEYASFPGVIVGCGIEEQEKLVTEIMNSCLSGTMHYGDSKTVGAKEGYLGFIFDDKGYTDNIPANMQAKFKEFYDKVVAGQVAYTLPPL
ncbi:MAG: BMP family ABC transporter substrate-binding protein [Spirochaetaceae bacterium]|jgi:simple sugar transport system substrate-binding protein|nr:BMP family ABC transporter substrate-binding protein [Spirochaetaceae bacterium]